MRYCPNDRCPHHLRAEDVAAEVTACPFCLTPLVSAPAAPTGAPADPTAWRRPAALTALVGAATFALTHLPPPFASLEGAPSGPLVALSSLSYGTLGAAPIASGFLLVEVGSMLTAAGRAARETATGRARMTRIAWAVTALVALAQTFMLYRILQATPEFFSRHASLDTDAGTYAVADAAYVLLNFVALVALARAVDRRGLGSGVALLSCIVVTAPLLGAFLTPDVEFVPGRVAALALLGGAVCAATASVLRRRYALVRTSESPRPAAYRAAARAVHADVLSLRAPLGGVVPVTLLGLLLDAAATLGVADPLPSASRSPAERALLLGALSCALAAALGQWFNAPRRAAAAAGAYGDARPVAEREADAGLVWRAALRPTLAYTAALAAATVAAAWLASPLQVAALAFATAYALDLAAELRVRRAAGPLAPLLVESRVAAADAACARLALAGVPAVVRNGHLRALTHWLAPHLPLTILVPAAEVARARDALGAAGSAS